MGRKNVVVMGGEKVEIVAVILTVNMILLVISSLIQAIIKYLPVHILCTMKYLLSCPLNSQNLSTMFRSRCRPGKANLTWT